MDGWNSQSCSTRSPEGCGRYRPKHLETVRRYLSNRHWACQALAVLNLIGVVDSAGMPKNRLHIKMCKLAAEMCETYFIVPSNGRSSPGIKCPESLYMRITDLTISGAPCYFIRSTQWEHIP
eukprot:8577823-Pyramimonas_sp.AAC.1